MSKDNVIKINVKRRKYFLEKARNVIKLAYIWWTIVVLIIAVVLLVFSYHLRNCSPWLSGVLVSASCGCFTGLVLFYLSNMRNNKEHNLLNEYDSVKHASNLLSLILHFGYYYSVNKVTPNQNGFALEDRNQVLDLLDNLEEARNQIEASVYDVIVSKGYDPLDRDNINSYRDKINAAENDESMEKSIIEICLELSPVVDELQRLLQEREDQISFLEKHFL